jgi:hypothetical protein
VNGNLLKMAAFPESSKIRARPGCTGSNGCLLVSSTKTLLTVLPFRTSGFPGDGGLDNVQSGLCVSGTGLTLVGLFNH